MLIVLQFNSKQCFVSIAHSEISHSVTLETIEALAFNNLLNLSEM